MTEQVNATVYVSNLPPGAIILWNGSLNGIPQGWAICNGSNGTPDLRGRFVVGAGPDYDYGAVGGQRSIALTTGNLPSHSHGYQQFQEKENTWLHGGNPSAGNGTGGLKESATDQVGQGEAFDISPPWFGLYYIMKTA
jgi:microcystin-dependent protein